ncbi:MAG: sigma-70 family RNA polymerase sigma factor [Planctomycetes bacterium]|nr:sigma-70 family RNA polymerase sigma factor [Planctomycetota bacterium]
MSQLFPSSSAEAALLQKIRQGDPEAMALWFEENVDAVYLFVYYRVGKDPDLAADGTQATFAKAMEKLNEYDPDRGNMITWLRVLSRNVIRELLSARRKETQLQEVWENIDRKLEDIYERIDRELLPDEVLERKETQELVGMTLAHLPPQYRDVLQAKYLDGQSLETMARLRSTTLDSVKSMLRRARAAFRETFLTLARTETA